MEKKITVYIVALSALVDALSPEDVKVSDAAITIKSNVDLDGVLFTSKRQAVEASELVGRFGVETKVVTQKKVVKLA